MLKIQKVVQPKPYQPDRQSRPCITLSHKCNKGPEFFRLITHQSCTISVVICVYVCSVGRDKIINMWDIKEGIDGGKSKKTIPVFEVHKIISEYVVCMIMCL